MPRCCTTVWNFPCASPTRLGFSACNMGSMKEVIFLRLVEKFIWTVSIQETESLYSLGNTTKVFEYKLKGRAEKKALTSSHDSTRIGCALLPSEEPAAATLCPLVPHSYLSFKWYFFFPTVEGKVNWPDTCIASTLKAFPSCPVSYNTDKMWRRPKSTKSNLRAFDHSLFKNHEKRVCWLRLLTVDCILSKDDGSKNMTVFETDDSLQSLR